MKKCINCFKIKSKTEFYPKIKGNYNLVQSWCKKCNSEVQKTYKQKKKEIYDYAKS